jgi:ABC-type lipoprotein release transport system permease subunit
MLVAEAGYGSLDPEVLDPAIAREPGITSWATLAFGQGTVAGQPLPVIGLAPGRGTIAPSLTSGRTVRSRGEVVLGRSTLRSLHRSVGDPVRIVINGRSARLRIVGVAAMPSIGQGGADHTSLGRGAVMRFEDLADLMAPGTTCLATEDALCAQALVFDVAPGSDGDAIARRIASIDPDTTPGGTYEQAITRAADIRNYDQMRSLPLALAGALASAAVVAFGFSLTATVRARGRELAVLRALGFTSRQLRTTLVTHAVVIAVVATVVGVPLGIAAGRLQWIRFADDVGVVPLPVVAVPLLVTAAIAAVLLSALVALLPARLAARVTVGSLLRSE